MSKFAIIKSGGKQYIVKPGDKLKVEKLPLDKGQEFKFDKILLIADDKLIEVGQPLIKDAKVLAKVLEQGRDKKIRVVHYKAKTRQHKVYGHRQPHTLVEIEKIN